MRAPHLKWFAFGLLLALAAAGCSKRVSQIAGPGSETASSRARLIGRAAGGQAIQGAYIVVFKPIVADVNAAVADAAVSYGVSAQFSYRYALKGFAARLTAAQLDALQNDPRVDYI